MGVVEGIDGGKRIPQDPLHGQSLVSLPVVSTTSSSYGDVGLDLCAELLVVVELLGLCD